LGKRCQTDHCVGFSSTNQNFSWSKKWYTMMADGNNDNKILNIYVSYFLWWVGCYLLFCFLLVTNFMIWRLFIWFTMVTILIYTQGIFKNVLFVRFAVLVYTKSTQRIFQFQLEA
jgi:hypothetical protein